MSEFDWERALDDGDVCVEGQPAIAVFTNHHGHIVIRQQGENADGDTWVIVTPENAVDLARAVIRVAKQFAQPHADPKAVEREIKTLRTTLQAVGAPPLAPELPLESTDKKEFDQAN